MLNIIKSSQHWTQYPAQSIKELPRTPTHWVVLLSKNLPKFPNRPPNWSVWIDCCTLPEQDARNLGCKQSEKRCCEISTAAISSAIATNTPIFGKLKPHQNPTDPPCPNSLNAIAVSSLPATPTSSVPCIPRAPTPTLAWIFEQTPTPHQRNCGNPKARVTTTANLSCNHGSDGLWNSS